MKRPTDSGVSIAVLGPGSWGTALAILLARNGHDTRLWGLEKEIEVIAKDGENRRFLPGIPLPAGLSPMASLADAVADVSDILIVVPSHAFRSVAEQMAPLVASSTGISWATKGFDPNTNQLMSEVAAEVLPGRALASLSGPTFAAEVARDLPTAITVGSSDGALADHIAAMLRSDTFRAYTSSDLIGVQVGGATKNVMAIAAGISDGLGFGANARTALITRGLAEISRLSAVLGGRPETLMGLAGLGDLVLTCTDDQSRNRRMGLALARGLSIDEAKAEIGQEVEGVNTTREVHAKAHKLGIEMPITEEVYRILYEGLDPHQAVKDLLQREPKAELG